MKQIIQSYRTGKLQMVEVPPPALQPRGILVRTRCSLVSAGTEKMVMELAKKSLLGKARARPDLVRQVMAKVKKEGLRSTARKVFSRLDEPVPLGYSSAGVVIEAGAEAPGFAAGQRVACSGAGYASHAELNYVPRNLAVPVPEGVSLEEACFVALGAIALQAMRRLGPQVGETIGVIGLGLVGQLTVQLLKAAGCKVVGADLSAAKMELAQLMGAEAVVPPEEMEQAAADLSRGRGLDGVIIAAATSSNEPVELAGRIARLGGRVSVVGAVGMSVPRNLYYQKELSLSLSMSYGPGRYDPEYEERGRDYPYPYVRWTEQRNMEAFLELVKGKRVTLEPLVSHRFDLDQALNAYQVMEGAGDYLGMVLSYPEPTETPARKISLRSGAPARGEVLVGLIGAGNFARGVLLPILKKAPKVSLVSLCTATGISAEATAGKWGFTEITTDPGEVMASPDVNTVFICTPHDLHASLVVRALEAGKHVFVEKPLCIAEPELSDIEAALDEAQSRFGSVPVLMVGFNRRFAPRTAELRRKLAARGGPMIINYRVNAGLIPPGHWIQDPGVGGGRIIGEACHFIDLMQHIIGSQPVSVFARAVSGGRGDLVDEDVCVLVIRFADGSLGNLVYSALGSPDLPKERLEVLAMDAAYLIEDFRGLHWLEKDERGGDRTGGQDKGFTAEMAAFLRAVMAGGPAPIPWRQLKATSLASFRAVESLRTGKEREV